MENLVITPTGMSLEESESNLAGKVFLIFHAQPNDITIVLTWEQAQQLGEDLIDYAT